MPAISTDNKILNKALSDADCALGRLDGAIEILPEPALFLSMFVRSEATLSSQIEGTQASLNEVVQAEIRPEAKAKSSDIREVNNYISAIFRGMDSLEKLPVSVRLICELHAILMKDVRGQHQTPGEVRRSQNWIGPKGCALKNARFIPPPQHEVPKSLSDLEKFIHLNDDMPVLIKAGLVHGQFETIHPFLDGNGRLGRLLITLILVEKKILSLPVLYLSLYFKKHRSEYYEKLQNIRDYGQWEDWLIFFLRGVAQVSNLAAQTAKNVVKLREVDRQKIAEYFQRSATMPLKLQDLLYRLPGITSASLQKEMNISNPTANKILSGFEEIGILKELTGQKRNKVYIYEHYMDIFEGLENQI